MLNIKLTKRVQIPKHLLTRNVDEYWEVGEELMLLERREGGSILAMTLAGPMVIPADSFVEKK